MPRPRLNRSTSCLSGQRGLNHHTIWESESDNGTEEVRKSVSCLKVSRNSAVYASIESQHLSGAVKTFKSMQEHKNVGQSVSVSPRETNSSAIPYLQHPNSPSYHNDVAMKASGSPTIVPNASPVHLNHSNARIDQHSPSGRGLPLKTSPRPGKPVQIVDMASAVGRNHGQYAALSIPSHTQHPRTKSNQNYHCGDNDALDTQREHKTQRSEKQSSGHAVPKNIQRSRSVSANRHVSPISSFKRNSSHDISNMEVLPIHPSVKRNSVSDISSFRVLQPSFVRSYLHNPGGRENMHSPAEQSSADNSQLPKSPVNMKPNNNRRKSSDKSRPLVYLPPETLSDVTEGSRPATDASNIAKSVLFGAQSSIRVKKSGDKKQKKEKTNSGKVRDRKELNHSDMKANKNDSGGKGSESLLAKPAFVQNILRSPSPKGERGNGLHSGISLPENDLRSKVKETGGTLKPRSKKSKEQSASSKLKQYNDEQQRAADRDMSSLSGEENLDAESDEITVSLTMEEFLFENAAQVEKLEPKTQMSMEEFLCESRVGTQTVADGISC